MNIRIGTRGSRLALAQAEWVRDILQNCGHSCSIIVLKSTGDLIQDKPLAEIGGKGLFVERFEQALLQNEIDLAVHSMKDLPSTLAKGLTLSKTWPRAPKSDVLVLRQGLTRLPPRARVGTGSGRRGAQLLKLFEDAQIMGIRGNVDTRLRKLDEGQYDALVAAEAALTRLGLQSRISMRFTPEQMIPAPAQGALALELRQTDAALLTVLNGLADEAAHAEVRAERAVLEAAEGSCTVPVGACCTIQEGNAVLYAFLADANGTKAESLCLTGPAEQAEELGRRAALRLRALLNEQKGGDL